MIIMVLFCSCIIIAPLLPFWLICSSPLILCYQAVFFFFLNGGQAARDFVPPNGVHSKKSEAYFSEFPFALGVWLPVLVHSHFWARREHTLGLSFTKKFIFFDAEAVYLHFAIGADEQWGIQSKTNWADLSSGVWEAPHSRSHWHGDFNNLYLWFWNTKQIISYLQRCSQFTICFRHAPLNLRQWHPSMNIFFHALYWWWFRLILAINKSRIGITSILCNHEDQSQVTSSGLKRNLGWP